MFPTNHLTLEQWIDGLPMGETITVTRDVVDDEYVTSLISDQTQETYVITEPKLTLKRPKKGGMARLAKRLEQLAGNNEGE